MCVNEKNAIEVKVNADLRERRRGLVSGQIVEVVH